MFQRGKVLSELLIFIPLIIIAGIGMYVFSKWLEEKNNRDCFPDDEERQSSENVKETKQ